MTAQQILESKGYDNSECADILQADDANLDMQVREKYGLGNEPLHLWESYYRGDASKKALKKAAKKHGLESIDDLLSAMDSDLIELAEKYPSK